MSFDWSKVEGYREDMSADEKLALLDNYNPEPAGGEPSPTPDPAPAPAPAPAGNQSLKGYVTKAQFDKVSSELATAKKQLRSRMSEDEQKELDRQAETEAMQAELKTLRREKAHSSYKASYLSQGYDEQLAEEAATAMVDGDTDGLFAAMKKHSTSMEKAMRAKILKETPTPPAGINPSEDEKAKKEEAALRASFGLPKL